MGYPSLAQMNARKRGHPFQYPTLFIEWMACVHLFLHYALSPDGGIHQKTLPIYPGLLSADYTTLFSRIKDLNLALDVDPRILSNDVIVAVDSTGIKVTNRGEWMQNFFMTVH